MCPRILESEGKKVQISFSGSIEKCLFNVVPLMLWHHEMLLDGVKVPFQSYFLIDIDYSALTITCKVLIVRNFQNLGQIQLNLELSACIWLTLDHCWCISQEIIFRLSMNPLRLDGRFCNNGALLESREISDLLCTQLIILKFMDLEARK